jgi:hypothetical protein
MSEQPVIGNRVIGATRWKILFTRATLGTCLLYEQAFIVPRSAPRIAEDSPAAEGMGVEDPLMPDWWPPITDY